MKNSIIYPVNSVHSQTLNPTSYSLIYIYTRPEFPNFCKIGKTSLSTDEAIDCIEDNSELLIKEAKERIKQQTNTASVKFELKYVTIALADFGGFTDTDFHNFLERNNFKKCSPEKDDNGNNIGNEWFEISPEQAINYLTQFKHGKKVIENKNVKISFRPEQNKAIKMTLENYRYSCWKKQEGKMLWNAIMRFGKTLVTYGFIDETNKKCIKSEIKTPINKILILTHKPAVEQGWFNEYRNYFSSTNQLDQYEFSSKRYGKKWKEIDKSKKIIVFLSIQDLRGKQRNDNSTEMILNNNEIKEYKEKNKDYFNTEWDLVVIDEAHEGNMTELADQMHEHLKRKFTLYLSGTPFKLLAQNERAKFNIQKEVFDWDYVQEQTAKNNWYIDHKDEQNPYEELPAIKINTIDIYKTLKDKINYPDFGKEMGFDFSFFFEVDEAARFKREKDIDLWLDNMCTENKDDLDNLSSMPYSTKNRHYNRHSLWHLPGVIEAKTLEKKLKSHHFFKNFQIINVTGSQTNANKALNEVKEKIRGKNNNPLSTWTITLSCGRLTTGVTIPEWTTVLMLSNTNSAQAYLQTIFRTKTPWKLNGFYKTQGIVYDFSPTRVLEIISEYANIVSVKKLTNEKEKKSESIIKELINYMPVISFNGNSFKFINCDEIMEGIKKIYVQNIVKNGFDTFDVLKRSAFDELEINEAEEWELKIASGHSKSTKNSNLIVINENEDINNVLFSTTGDGDKVKINGKVNKIISEEEKKRKKTIENLKRACLKISKRLPLMLIALTPEKIDEFKLERFPSYYDAEDWIEFMQEITKEDFKEITKRFFDEKAVEGAVKKWCRDIDEIFKEQNFDNQIEGLKNIFSKIKNPDKETVLTPWYVIDIHFKRTNLDWKTLLKENKGKLCILDINAKSGMYPLYALWSLWNYFDKKVDQVQLIKKHIYVNCRTDAARKITRRVLGIRDKKYDSWANKHIIKYDIFKRYNELKHLD